MLVHYTRNNTNYLFILLETCVTCVTSVTLPRHLPTENNTFLCLRTHQNRKNFRENRKNFREDRENSMVSEPSSTSEANKLER